MHMLRIDGLVRAWEDGPSYAWRTRSSVSEGAYAIDESLGLCATVLALANRLDAIGSDRHRPLGAEAHRIAPVEDKHGALPMWHGTRARLASPLTLSSRETH